MTIEVTLFSIDEDLVDQWRQSFFALVPDEVRDRVSFVHTSLQKLNRTFDCIVSPANSFGRFDGGFDQILTEVLAPADDQEALTRTAQTVLYQRWRGFAPPGTCTLIPLTGTPCHPNTFDCRYIALCPTMRFPSNVTWHKEIVYNCVWSLLVAIDEHNARAAEKDSGLAPIASVGMTGLATGIGRVSPAVCARQTAYAFAHYQDAKNHPEKWSSLSWDDIFEMPLDGRLPMDG
ncbi:macro domain-like protein [Polyporus arcularius HHB13444]|uniref:Macro domain-like protein n=1 Tax=Polyporus arcularius HHB13444 TaxID=1314778 RepID=A0A5C3NUG7_9APHY|nr:macro domain-like protein [Polyporus arcularius HHB13444]